MAAYAPITYKKSEASATFEIPFDYLSQKFVQVYVEDIKKVYGLDYDFLDKTRIRFLTGNIQAGVAVTLKRQTDAGQRLVSWRDASVLKASDLELSQLQLLHVAEEAAVVAGLALGLDYDSNWNALGRRIVRLGDPLKATDATNKQWVEEYVGSLWESSQGPGNSANNVIYVYPDGIARPLQTLSQKGNAALGSAGIAHGSGTVREALLALQSSLQSLGIDLNSVAASTASALERAETGVFGDVMMRTRVRVAISENPSIMILGDSISHGAFAVDLYRNSWVNLLKRMLNRDYAVNSYGFVPLMTMGAGATLSQDIHNISFYGAGGVGTPHTWDARSAETGGHVAQGLSWVSQATGNTLATRIPTFQRKLFVWYVGNPGGGSFDIKVNGVVTYTVNTNSSTVTPLNVQVVQILDNGAGSCNIECVAKDVSTVELCGFSYNDQINSLTVNNFSTSGRRLRWINESTIKETLKGSAMLIMALGYNDSGSNRIDPAYFAEFIKRIDWLIQYANLYEVPVVVPDFVWPYSAEDPTRLQLKRLATETKGVYIPFPDMFQKSGVSSDDFRVNTLKLFTDGAHPNIEGHKYIAEVIARRLGLSCSSKKIALDYYDWWYPLPLSSSGITNVSTLSDLVSAVKNHGSTIQIRLFIKGLNGSAQRAVCDSLPPRAGINLAFSSIHPLMPKSDGTSRGTLSLTSSGILASPNAQNDVQQHTIFIDVPSLDHRA